jgi:F-type H+-transporting ATPase subunit a
MVIFRITKNTTHFLRHLVPLSTPLPLSQFIVIIESISQLIRPITLSVRLAANITAGHILIALRRSTTVILNPLSLILLTLFILEIAVAVIQRYVFTILMAIYLEEAYDNTTSPIPYSVP